MHSHVREYLPTILSFARAQGWEGGTGDLSTFEEFSRLTLELPTINGLHCDRSSRNDRMSSLREKKIDICSVRWGNVNLPLFSSLLFFFIILNVKGKSVR